jgi:hypothetical protein
MKKTYWLIAGAIASITLGTKVYEGYDRHDDIAAPSAATLPFTEPLGGKDTVAAVSAVAAPGQAGKAAYPQSQAKSPEPVAPGEFANGEPRVAQNPYQDPGRSASEQSEIDANTVRKALEDPNPKVRLQALLQFHGSDALPPDTLAALAHSDAAETVRLAALRLAVSSPNANADQLRSMAELALNDPNEAIRTQAHDILDQMEAGTALASAKGPDPQETAQ